MKPKTARTLAWGLKLGECIKPQVYAYACEAKYQARADEKVILVEIKEVKNDQRNR